MDIRSNHNTESIDHKTSRSICDAIGERLQDQLRPETTQPSLRLRQLLEEIRRRDV